MIQTFDDRDALLVASRRVALDAVAGPRVGDFVIFADGVTRRISHVWDCWEDMPASVQTSDDGSYYLGDGYVSMSGGLHPGIPSDTLTLTDELRPGAVWIFHHDLWGAGRGVETEIPFRVFTTTERGAR